MKALKPVLVIVMMVSIISTASPVYAAENRVFHMSLYIHNWRGDTTSLEFYDGTGASDEQEADITVDEEPDADIIVDEEEPADEATDSDQIPSVVIEEITSEQTSDPEIVEAQNAEEITIIMTEETIEGLIIDTGTEVITTEDPEIEAAPEPEIITIITTDNDTEEVDTITTEVGEPQDDNTLEK